MISIDHIIDMNATSIEKLGGLFVGDTNLRSDGYGKLSYALQYCTAISDDPYLQAAFLCQKIVCGHPFNDGNKRTGFFACMVYLAAWNIQAIIDPDSIHGAVLRLINHTWDYYDFAEYLKQ